MKLKKLLSFALALAMVLAFMPAMSLTASAAEEQTLWDMSTIADSISGQELQVTNYGLTADGYARLNAKNWDNGVWGSGTSPTLSFFKSDSVTTDHTITVSFNDADKTADAEKISVTFAFAAMSNKGSHYQTWYLNDREGNAFAEFIFDNGTNNDAGNQAIVGMNNNTYTIVAKAYADTDTRAAVNALRGVYFNVTAEKNSDNTYTVTYSYDPDADGTYETILTDTVDSIDGIGSVSAFIGKWNTDWGGMGMQDLVVTYTLPDTTVFVTAQYIADGEVVVEETLTYDTAKEENSVTFPAKYYSADGSNTLYYAEETPLSANDEIPMTALPNNDVSGYSKDALVTIDDTVYMVNSGNLIPNGDFTYDLNGWFGADGNAASTSKWTLGTNTITLGNGGGPGSSYDPGLSLYRAWSVTPGKTYLYTYNVSASQSYHITSLQTYLYQDEHTAASNGTGEVLVGTTANNNEYGSLAHYDVAGTNTYLFTVPENSTYQYLQALYRWSNGHIFSNFGLYEIEEKSLGVELINGAQIRIGSGVDTSGEKLANMKDSGLRFIAKVKRENTLASDGVADEIGIAILPSADTEVDETNAVAVADDKWQSDTVFTVAVVDIAEKNYNTVYYAKPYVKINGKYYTDDTYVARTPYQVAAGILVASADGTVTDGDNYQTTITSETLYKVLNVYANTTGARLTLVSDGSGYVVEADIEDNTNASDGVYANGAKAFFIIQSNDFNDAGDYVIVLEGDGAAKFYSYAGTKYRINNSRENFESVTGAYAVADTEANTLTITIPKSYFDSLSTGTAD